MPNLEALLAASAAEAAYDRRCAIASTRHNLALARDLRLLGYRRAMTIEFLLAAGRARRIAVGIKR